MLLLLTMAGRYRRFREFSYEIPKYFLPLSNRTVVHHVLDTMLKSRHFDDVLLVANSRDERFRPQLISTLNEFGFGSNNLKFIDDTPGQSMSAYEALVERDDVPVAIHNIDTILLGRDFVKPCAEIEDVDCILDVFYANDPAYSYVLKDDTENKVSVIAEKEVISGTASSGCYFFKSSKVFCRYAALSATQKEYFISAAIMKMINDGLKVKTSQVYNEDSTVVLGTPSEYISSIGTFDLLCRHYKKM